MDKRTHPSIMQNVDSEVAILIAQELGVSNMEGLRRFLASEAHALAEDDSLKLWHFSPLAIYDMWQCEMATGDPRNSLYLRGDDHE